MFTCFVSCCFADLGSVVRLRCWFAALVYLFELPYGLWVVLLRVIWFVFVDYVWVFWVVVCGVAV